MEIELTSEQENCIDKIKKYLINFFTNNNNDNRKTFYIDGYAGTGKTTTIGFLTDIIRNDPDLSYYYKTIAFLTFTGKASSVLKTKLINDFNVFNKKDHYIGTIHSLLYTPIMEWDSETKTKKIVGWEKRKNDDMYNLIIIDEASMVDDFILKDLLSYDVPILLFGDSFQLPPIQKSTKSKSKKNYSLSNPDVKITEIHRQALENPIIYLSMFVRKNYYIPEGIFSKHVFKMNWNNDKTKELFYNVNFKTNFDNINNICVLTGYNKTRVSINKLIRKNIKVNDKITISSGDRIVCLLNNDVVSNGQLGLVLYEKFEPIYNLWRLDIKFDNDYISQFYCHDKFFNAYNKYNIYDELINLQNKHKRIRNYINCFDYGYSLTVHKCQGSEFDKIVLFEEKLPKMSDYDFARWLYTGITRAKNKLFVISK